MDALVDHQPLDLVEVRRVRGVVVGAIGAAGDRVAGHEQQHGNLEALRGLGGLGQIHRPLLQQGAGGCAGGELGQAVARHADQRVARLQQLAGHGQAGAGWRRVGADGGERGAHLAELRTQFRRDVQTAELFVQAAPLTPVPAIVSGRAVE